MTNSIKLCYNLSGDVMLGAIIGDIAGSTYEVDEVMALKNKQINYSNRMKILDKGTPLFIENSSYTDDTVLTAALANALLTDKDYYKNLKEFGLREISLGLDKYGRSRFGKGFCAWLKGESIGESNGNGCAMRVSPIANYFDDLKEIIDNTRKATSTSHNHIESHQATEMVSCCIYFAKQKRCKEYIKSYIETNYDCNLNFNLDELQRTYKFTSKAKDSVPQAIFCFLESNSFEDAIRKAISIGGDSDTIAAITGSIAEVYYGIDKDLIKKVEPYLPEYVINITNAFYKKIGKEEPFKSELKDFLKEQNLYKEEYFDFMKGKIKVFPSDTSLDWFGCFPIVEDGILKDIRMLVPEIKTEKNLLVNIHEHIHGLELFNELGTVYEERREEREANASNMENVYLKKKS